MTLRNGKQYLRYDYEENDNSQFSVVKSELTPHVVSIINLLTKITNYYDIQNCENKKNITEKEFINQKIRDYREFFYLTMYYIVSFKTPTFIYFLDSCKKKASCLILQLKAILNNLIPNVVLTDNDKTNAVGLLKDLEKFLQMLKDM